MQLTKNIKADEAKDERNQKIVEEYERIVPERRGNARRDRIPMGSLLDMEREKCLAPPSNPRI
jgi:hypothetical protein